MPSHLDLAEVHVWESDPAPEEIDRQVAFLSRHLAGRRRVLDVGSGEGHLLAGLVRAGFAAEGVDLTRELAERARGKGLTVTLADAGAFLREHASRFDAVVMSDFVEHVPVETTLEILAALAPGTRVYIQTPNTNSVLGHQFYLQVPSHQVPLSPFVLGKMLRRTGVRLLEEGTLYGGSPWTGLRRRLTDFVLVKLLGTVTARLLTEGANYYLFGEKTG